MAGLGSPDADLDAAYDRDQFAGLKSALDALRADARNGGDRYRILFPNSQDPLNRIANSRAWLGQYARFRSNSGLDLTAELQSTERFWFVGSSFGRTADQTARFLTDGIWEVNTPKPSDIELVRNMQVGDRIAIKASFVQRLIAAWKRQAIEGMTSTFAGASDVARASGEAEIDELHSKIGQLVVERDFLAKAFGR